jgi:thymidylate synthase (FAD)
MKIVNHSKVELIDSMGSDLTVVNAARVSFDKESFWKEYEDGELHERDKKLINYLARYNHWSPFAHTSIQLRVSAPIFVARQLVKHQVGGVWNEVSRRYVDDEPVFYFPKQWRKRAENLKQGSSDEKVNVFDVTKDIEMLLDSYNLLLEQSVAPEQARMILPQNTMTSWYWTGSLMFFNRVFKQRIDSHAQKETQEVAKQIGDICAKLFPASWNALNTSGQK